jgi:hypothetical protein
MRSRTTTSTGIYIGHIVHIKDLDGGTEWNVEVTVLETVSQVDLPSIACKAAEKDPVAVIMSGNTLEYEYMQPSGKKIEVVRVTTKTLLSDTDDSALKLLEDRTID